jgi:hypothetical protein
LDQDSSLCVNDGGVEKCLTIDGPTGNVNAPANLSAVGTISGTLADNIVGSSQIIDGSIVNADINASAAIDYSKLAAGSSLSVLGRGTSSSGANASIVAGTDHHVLRRSGTSLGFGLLTNNNIDESANIAGTKIVSSFGDQNVELSKSHAVALSNSVIMSGAVPQLRVSNTAAFNQSGSAVLLETRGSGFAAVAAVAETAAQTRLSFWTTASASSLVEHMRITPSGVIRMQSDSDVPADGSGTGVVVSPVGVLHASRPGAAIFANRHSGTGTVISLRNESTEVGRIQVTASATSYLTSSDYRLKENLIPVEGATEMLMAVPVWSYDWKKGGHSTAGFLAHELAEVLPEAVDGEKDGENMQAVDYAKLVPLLVASIQELKAEIEQLKAAQ